MEIELNKPIKYTKEEEKYYKPLINNGIELGFDIFLIFEFRKGNNKDTGTLCIPPYAENYDVEDIASELFDELKDNETMNISVALSPVKRINEEEDEDFWMPRLMTRLEVFEDLSYAKDALINLGKTIGIYDMGEFDSNKYPIFQLLNEIIPDIRESLSSYGSEIAKDYKTLLDDLDSASDDEGMDLIFDFFVSVVSRYIDLCSYVSCNLFYTVYDEVVDLYKKIMDIYLVAYYHRRSVLTYLTFHQDHHALDSISEEIKITEDISGKALIGKEGNTMLIITEKDD